MANGIVAIVFCVLSSFLLCISFVLRRTAVCLFSVFGLRRREGLRYRDTERAKRRATKREHKRATTAARATAGQPWRPATRAGAGSWPPGPPRPHQRARSGPDDVDVTDPPAVKPLAISRLTTLNVASCTCKGVLLFDVCRTLCDSFCTMVLHAIDRDLVCTMTCNALDIPRGVVGCVVPVGRQPLGVVRD